MLLNRPLQPTHDTSTHEPLDFWARNSRCGRPLDVSPTEIGFFRAAPDHLAAIRSQLGTRLTARLQLRSSRTRHSHAPFDPREPSTACFDGAPLARRFRPSFRVGERPLTPPVAPRSRSGNPACFEEPGPLLPPSRQRERLSRPRAPFLDKCSQECCFRRRSGLREPATDLAALPPTIRLPTLLHPPSALAWEG